MVKQSIQIFVRLKPTKGRCGLYDIDVDSDSSSTLLTFIVPRDLSGGIINNKKEHYKFRFQRSFNQDSKQEEVFECVSKPVIDNVLQGYNGTVFAYGQTGSGKTFTITGGAERYADRGIIPRTLSHIFEKFEKTPELLYTLHISYLEIYNENGYDLLDPKHDAAKLEDLPKVILLEDSDQNIHLKNLTIHQANNEEEALNLLFLGDTNRMIAETPMNQASTRSHCIFTIHITSRETGSAIIRRSKLHLVDLAGSERVAKSGMNGILLTEAKYINLSLHYLEQVIVALSEKNRQHVPYRNSMMTSVLRDSLGGNCMTSMIATCSVDRRNIDESISSCRFAQRVALIKNEAVLNEELDPKLMIHRLKREVHQLREELALRTGEERTDNLSEEEKESCLQSVKNFLDDNDSDATLMVKGDMRKIQECFRIFKKHVLEKQSLQFEVPRRNEGNENETEKNLDVCLYSDKEVTKLKDILQQRDNEINILVNMLKKEKKRTAEVAAKQDFQNVRSASASNSRNISEIEQSISRDSAREDSWSHQGKQFPLIEKTKSKIFSNMSLGRQQAFKIFRRDYEHNQTIENNKQVLKQRYAEAKELGQRVNQSRTTINQFKGQIERHRLQLLLQGLVDSDDSMPDQVEQNLRKKIEREKLEYKEYFNRLRILKTEIEHLQHLMEKAKMKLLKDFELWWAEQAVATQRGQPSPDQLESQVVSAWRTPPLTPLNKRTAVNHFSDPFTADERDHSLSFTSVGSGGVVTGILSGFQTTKNETTVTEVCAVDTSHSNLTLTGDPKADADILAFVKARQNLLQQNPMGRR